MNQDYLDPINSEGMPDLANSFLALDFLLSVKTGVRNYAFALSETATPEVRNMLRTQLDQSIALHEELSRLMIEKGWLHPVDTGKQYQLDMKSAQMTAQIAQMKLFPEDTSRLGTFATPEY
ncbi:spore coat protein [Paenibacillus sp. MDMC362]|uniref:spore coat protein n=1 Tax=Paenibacillus sp. MDMC362 TaxID=2977365 RepID=UPI000DC5C6FA|nr:spore coat protein [Paenibacillus sp. MDMC362]RAR43539.1 spore coat protein [Paenibacillus sp. MDMC362]